MYVIPKKEQEKIPSNLDYRLNTYRNKHDPALRAGTTCLVPNPTLISFLLFPSFFKFPGFMIIHKFTDRNFLKNSLQNTALGFRINFFNIGF